MNDIWYNRFMQYNQIQAERAIEQALQLPVEEFYARFPDGRVIDADVPVAQRGPLTENLLSRMYLRPFGAKWSIVQVLLTDNIGKVLVRVGNGRGRVCTWTGDRVNIDGVTSAIGASGSNQPSWLTHRMIHETRSLGYTWIDRGFVSWPAFLFRADLIGKRFWLNPVSVEYTKEIDMLMKLNHVVLGTIYHDVAFDFPWITEMSHGAEATTWFMQEQTRYPVNLIQNAMQRKKESPVHHV